MDSPVLWNDYSSVPLWNVDLASIVADLEILNRRLEGHTGRLLDSSLGDLSKRLSIACVVAANEIQSALAFERESAADPYSGEDATAKDALPSILSQLHADALSISLECLHLLWSDVPPRGQFPRPSGSSIHRIEENDSRRYDRRTGGIGDD